ncbi:MAG TPA: hypothetical protein ENJ45_03160 [Phaeodactylibacter sp.]|nr:hypothetical protein [Phaeodactylibacter sp.]
MEKVLFISIALFTTVGFWGPILNALPASHSFAHGLATGKHYVTADMSTADDLSGLDLAGTQTLQFKDGNGSMFNLTMTVTEATLGALLHATFYNIQDLSGYSLVSNQTLLFVERATGATESHDFIVEDFILE